MPEPIQATLGQLYPVGSVRVAEIGAAMLGALDQYCPFEAHRSGILDLALGLEAASLSAGKELDVILGRLTQNYGLLGIYTDPIRRALVPPIPLTPSRVRYFVLGTGRGLNVLGTGRLNNMLGTRIALEATEGAPSFNTRLLPGQTAGAVTYTGANGDYFEFDMPMIAATGGPQQMFLFVGGVQVAGIDFPSDAVGRYFRLNYDDTDYLGKFQVVPNTSRVDLLPE